MSGARPPTQHAGKALSLRYSDADASTICLLDAASVTRLKTSDLTRGNSNALTEVDAKASLARFPVSEGGVLRVGLGLTYPRPLHVPVGRAFTTATASDAKASDDKTRRRLHRRSPSSIKRCIFAHEAVDDEPTPAFCRGVELGGRE